MKAHLVQLDIAWERPDQNRARVLELIEDAPVERGDLVVLPEMFDTGFSMNTRATADAAGATLRFLEDLADDLDATVQGGRTVPGGPGGQGAARARNVMSVLVPRPDAEGGGASLACEYAKIHPFTLGGEHERFEPGREVVTYRWTRDSLGEGDGALVVCPAICYDLRFPELFRLGLRKGAEAYALGACWPSARQHHWRALLIARAIENQAFVLGVNRVGRDPPGPTGAGLAYAGGSIAVVPTGEVLGELGDAEGVLSVEIDARLVRAWREKFPAWKDARLLDGPRQ